MKTLDEVRGLVGALPEATLPVALLPVQVQTRYVTRDGAPELLVRVYPDDVHLDDHDEALTAAEVEWGRRAWELAWAAKGDAENPAWNGLADRFGARRASWIARRLTPTNVKQRPGTPPVFPDPGALRSEEVTRPVRARGLPDRWVVIGYQRGKRVILEAGAPIPAELPVGPTFDDAPLPDAGPDELPLDEGLRWLVDFDAAERVGMALRIAVPAALAGARLDTLLVFGVKGSLAPDAGTGELEGLLDAHRYTRGLAFTAPGTPTNNTTEVSSGFSRRNGSGGLGTELRARTPVKTSGAGLAARLLGVRPAVFTGVDGAARTDDLDARHLQTALWPVTGGYYLDQIMASPEPQSAALSDQQLDQARRYFVDFVRQLGPLPSLRVGRQPYGLLPVTSLELFGASAAGKGRFVPGLRFLRGVWRGALGTVPRLGEDAQDPDALVEILRMQPSSVGYRARLAFERQVFVPTGILTAPLDPQLRSHAVLLRERLRAATDQGVLSQERFFEIVPADTSTRLGAPLVTRAADAPETGLNPNYIAFLRTASFDDILNEVLPLDFPPRDELNTLLYLLLRHSVLLGYATTAYRILVRRGTLPAQRYREPVLVDILGATVPRPTRTLLRALDADPTLRSTLHTLTAAQEPEAAALDELRASLLHLEALPVDVLARQLAGCLDLWAYRLDAWITSLATRRLDEVRRQHPRGLLLGGFGWVHDLQASPRSPIAAPPGEQDAPLFAAEEVGGFIHAPSMAQASAAAVLRSGYIAHAGEADAGALAIDLSSERVRLAESLLDGVRQGQALGSLLGYRFERGLHDKGLDRFIAGFRRVSVLADVYRAQAMAADAQGEPIQVRIALLRAAAIAQSRALAALRTRYRLPPTATVAAIEAIAGASVVDGLTLVRLRRGVGVPLDRLGVALGNDGQRLEAELAALDRALDAVSDALTAEGVYQLVRGNPARAAASVDAVAHGEIQPPEQQFAQTPRPGTALTHRLVVVFSGPAPAVPADLRQARRAAEPNLDAWLRQLVGALTSVRCRADFLGEDDKVILTRDNVRLSASGLSNLDALYLGATGEPGRPSDLERMLEYNLRRGAPATVPPDAPIRIDYGRSAAFKPTELSLGEFLELTAAFRQAILGARAIDGRDLTQAEPETPSGVDADELRARADRAVAAFRKGSDGLTAQLAAATAAVDAPSLDVLRERLLDLVFLGVPEAVPVSARGNEPADRERLLAQAEVTAREAAGRLDRAEALKDGFDPAAATPDERVRHEQERLEAVFGRGFRALPLSRPANITELGTSLRRSDALLGGDPLQALSWLQGVSRVRPGASRLAAALGYAAALERTGALELKVAQLPAVAGERWVALPAPAGGEIPRGKLSLVAHLPRRFVATQPLAGLMLDEWVEIVPAAEVTTGLAFNYDSPGARPPQTVLLAVAPPETTQWDVETLEKILLETLELAQLRALDPQSLGTDAVLQRALPALYVSLNLAGDTVSTDFVRAVR